MQTSAVDWVVGVDVHDAQVWFLIRWFLWSLLVPWFGFSAFFLISDGLTL